MKKTYTFILILIATLLATPMSLNVFAADPTGTCKVTFNNPDSLGDHFTSKEFPGMTNADCKTKYKDGTNIPGEGTVLNGSVMWASDGSQVDSTVGICEVRYNSGVVQKFPTLTKTQCEETYKPGVGGVRTRTWAAPTPPPRSTPGDDNGSLGNCKNKSTKETVKGLTKTACESKGEDWQWTSYYYSLAPLPCETGSSVGCDGELKYFDPTGEGGGSIGEYLNIMIRIFIGICAVLAVMMVVIGGLEYMTSDLISSKEHGKERITGAIFGLLLALGSWTLLNQINPNLLKTELTSLEGVTVEVDLEADTPQTAVNGKYSNGYAVGSNWATVSGMAPTALPSWARVSPTGDCATVGQQHCTSLRGLLGTYVNKIHAGCNCPLIITGGTETWLHGGKTGRTSHVPGSPTVDLRITPELTRYIAGDKELVYFKRYEKDGMSFLYERDHWHVGR